MGHSAWKNEPDGPWTGEGPVCDSPLDEWGRCGGARAGGHGANKSSVLANCGLGARPHSLLREPALGAFRKVEGELGRLIKVVSTEVPAQAFLVSRQLSGLLAVGAVSAS